MKLSYKYLPVLMLVALSVWMAACGSGSATDRPIVTVSLQPQRYLLEQITGDRIDIRCLLSNGGDPESYDPSFTNLLNAENSLAYLAMGNIGFEDAVVEKIHNSNPDLKIFNTSEGINLIKGTHGDEHDADPHTWTSVKNARIIAANMLKAMLEIDPAGADTYRRNYATLDARLDSLDTAFTSRLQPLKGQAFMVWHPSLSYFARDYDLRQVSVGGAEHKESSVPDMQRRIDEARASGAKVFFFQKETDGRQAETINREIGAKEVNVSLLDPDWMGQMTQIVDALAPVQ